MTTDQFSGIGKHEYLHESLPVRFKVQLMESFEVDWSDLPGDHPLPSPILPGDTFTVVNILTRSYENLILAKRKRGYEIVTLDDVQRSSWFASRGHGGEAFNVIGMVVSFQRNCHGAFGTFLGDGRGLFPPDECNGCWRLLETLGVVSGESEIGCLTPSGVRLFDKRDEVDPCCGEYADRCTYSQAVVTPDDCVMNSIENLKKPDIESKSLSKRVTT